MAGPNGENDGVSTGCIRYRNLAAETINSVQFRRTFVSGSRNVLGSDIVEDHVKRKPNKNDMPGKVPVAAGYWKCTEKANPYGPKVSTIIIVSGKTWRLP
jgi:hypothetical protein